MHQPPDEQGCPERVLMALDPDWLELMFRGQKFHEFRKRFVRDVRVQWYCYLTEPVSRLAALVDLAPAIEGTPARIAAIAEADRSGNGRAVHAYLAQHGWGFAAPVRRVREFHGIDGRELAARLGTWSPPRRYVLLSQHSELDAVCASLPATGLRRETRVDGSSH